MNTIKINKDKALLIAHRGLSGIEPENTNSAFVAAGNRSFYGIETDIHLTTDNRFVITHDSSLLRTSGEDVNVENVSLRASQSVILFDKDKTQDRIDLRTPTLEDYLKICKRYEKHCVLELKSNFTKNHIKKIIKIIECFGYLDNVTFISFNYKNLQKVKSLLPNHSVQYLFWVITDEILDRLVTDNIDVDVHHPALTKELVDKIHNLGLKVNCWTVDKKERAEELVSWGVDFITTNILE